MGEAADLRGLRPDVTFDGGDLDCGSGLVLLLRDHMERVPVGGVLEMRSREPTVGEDLPPWCRMVGHELLGDLPGEGCTRFFLRRGAAATDGGEALEADRERAKDYEWRTRTRLTGSRESTVYARRCSFRVGRPASFEERDESPSAVEVLLGALASSLAAGFATECARDGLEIDDIEIAARGRLGNVLAHLGLEEGDPGFREIAVRCFASTLDDEVRVRAAWDRATARCPVAATLGKATDLALKMVIA
jgi:TusA-related sulfurtransferase